jgi:hypothetical protein
MTEQEMLVNLYRQLEKTAYRIAEVKSTLEDLTSYKRAVGKLEGKKKGYFMKKS